MLQQEFEPLVHDTINMERNFGQGRKLFRSLSTLRILRVGKNKKDMQPRNNSKHKWRFDQTLEDEDLLEKLTLAELYQLANCHPMIWEHFVREKCLTTIRKGQIILSLIRAIQKSPLSLEQCITRIRTNVIEKTGHILISMEREDMEQKQKQLDQHVEAVRTYLPLLSPLRLVDPNDDEEVDLVRFTREKEVSSLSNTDRNNCLACLEFVSCSNKNSYFIRVVKTRYFQVNLACKKMSIPSHYLTDVLVCASLKDVLPDVSIEAFLCILDFLFRNRKFSRISAGEKSKVETRVIKTPDKSTKSPQKIKETRPVAVAVQKDQARKEEQKQVTAGNHQLRDSLGKTELKEKTGKDKVKKEKVLEVKIVGGTLLKKSAIAALKEKQENQQKGSVKKIPVKEEKALKKKHGTQQETSVKEVKTSKKTAKKEDEEEEQEEEKDEEEDESPKENDEESEEYERDSEAEDKEEEEEDEGNEEEEES